MLCNNQSVMFEKTEHGRFFSLRAQNDRRRFNEKKVIPISRKNTALCSWSACLL